MAFALQFSIKLLATHTKPLLARCAATLGLLLVTATTAASQTPVDCTRLMSLGLPQARVVSAEAVPGGSFTPPQRTYVQNNAPLPGLPAFCRVVLALTPSTDSDIRSEVWLPANWNGRLQMLGNGGWAGLVSYAGLAEAVRAGYAGVATDGGHEQNRGMFALGHPEKVTDFGWRAVHETVVKAKAVLTAHYGKAPDYSYWNSCSTGGRQGLMEAQRFPADFDGIVAGAPAVDMFRLHTAWMWNFMATHQVADGFIPSAKLPIVQRAAIAACDALDGAVDGLIGAPLACRFDPKSLVCAGPDRPDCLTAAQADSVARVYGGMRSKDGRPLYPGPEPGSEFGWGFHSGETTPAQPARDTLAYAIYQDANWDWRTFEVDAALARGQQADGGRVAAADPDLSAFFRRGGKLLLYHGWTDPNIPPRNTIAYYDAVTRTLGGAVRVDGSMRLFLLPGMGHCGGGYGPNQFDEMPVISAWVEQGRAPERIIARRMNGGAAERTRPICVHPKVAKYNGAGSLDDAANFSCVAPST